MRTGWMSIIVALLYGLSLAATIEYPYAALGTQEVVFDWSRDRCEDENIPDAPVHAVRDAAGRIQIVLSHYRSYRMIGADFNSLRVDCSAPIGQSHHNPDPAAFDDNEWFGGGYTLDGVTFYGKMHMEYHGYEHSGQCATSSPTSTCWYNAVTSCMSTDTGRSYTHAQPPFHLVAASPYRYIPNAGPYGVFGGSNIVYNPRDGFYYHFVGYLDLPWYNRRGSILMRASGFCDTCTWRGWDGKDFTYKFFNPYDSSFTDTAAHVPCLLSGVGGSLSWNTFYNCWLSVGTYSAGRGRKGFVMSLSEDLVTWSRPVFIMFCNIYEDPDDATSTRYGYPSVIDHNDTSRNFEITGQTCYLYYTRWNSPSLSLYDRDLIRRPITFQKRLVNSFTVNDSGYGEDINQGDGLCATAQGRCSMTAAVMESNARLPKYRDSVLTIGFNVPGRGIVRTGSGIPPVTAPVFIDGFTQPGAVPNTAPMDKPANAQLKISVDAQNGSFLRLMETRNCTVRGLAVRRVGGTAITVSGGGDHTFVGNYLGTNATGDSALVGSCIAISLEGATGCRIGGEDPAERNIIVGGIYIGNDSVSVSSDNVIKGNFVNLLSRGDSLAVSNLYGIVIEGCNTQVGGPDLASRNVIAGGIRLSGPVCFGNRLYGNLIGLDITGRRSLRCNGSGITIEKGAHHNSIGGSIPGSENVISGHRGNGILISDTLTDANEISNNIIGATAQLDSSIGNEGAGVFVINGAQKTTIGKGNVICGSLDAGIWLDGAGAGTVIQGNYIGASRDSIVALGNAGCGILIYDARPPVIIGGTGSEEANLIRFNSGAGVALRHTAPSGIRISGNSINDNGSLGIDLQWDNMPEVIDPLDTDEGANGRQNFPRLLEALLINDSVRIQGRLSASALSRFRLEFFASPSADPSGYGEGLVFIGHDSVFTDSNGVATFEFAGTRPSKVDTGWVVSATATAADGSTSELSAAIVLKASSVCLTTRPSSIRMSLIRNSVGHCTLTVINSCTNSVTWSVRHSQTWLSSSVETATLPSGAQLPVLITVRTYGLSNGEYADTLVFSLSGLSFTIRVPVALSVIPLTQVTLVPDTLRLTVPIGTDTAAYFVVHNTGDIRLNWTMFTTTPWLSPRSPYSGSLAPGESAHAVIDVYSRDFPEGTDTRGIASVRATDTANLYDTSITGTIVLMVRTPTHVLNRVPKKFSLGCFSARGIPILHVGLPQAAKLHVRFFTPDGRQRAVVVTPMLSAGFHILSLPPALHRNSLLWFYHVIAQGASQWESRGTAVLTR